MDETFAAALERYVSIFRRGESAIDGIRAELNHIRGDSMLPVHRQGIDSLIAHLTVAELAIETLGNQCNELWKMQKAKEQ